MARRRMISAELITDDEFNSLSIEAQNLFLRMLVISDDCGVVPSTIFTLISLTNPPVIMRENIGKFISEIVETGMGTLIRHNKKIFFLFKRHSFDQHQSYILGKRKRSEYLKISYKEFEAKNFQEVPRLSDDATHPRVKRRKYRLSSNKQKENSDDAEYISKDMAIPESLEEVTDWFKKNSYLEPESEAEKFWNYNGSKGWTVGHSPMKNWRMAATAWNSKNKEKVEHGTILGSGKKNRNITQDDLTSSFEIAKSINRLQSDQGKEVRGNLIDSAGSGIEQKPL